MLTLSSIVWIQPKFITFYQRIHQTYTRVAADSVSRKTMLIAGLPAWRFSPTTSAGHCLTIESYWPQDITWQLNPSTIAEHCLQFSPVRRTLLDNSVVVPMTLLDNSVLLRPQDIARQFSPVRRTLLDNLVLLRPASIDTNFFSIFMFIWFGEIPEQKEHLIKCVSV